MLLKNWWIKFGCFLTGYNYTIVNASSEVAAKAVKRYTAAMVIVSIVWSFIGYTFTKRYLQGNEFACIAGSLFAVTIVIQIERQIILSMKPSKWLYFFRGCLALMMAILGAVIIDQIILKQDIELEKISYIDKRVDSLLPSKTNELKNIIYALDTTIQAKENEKQKLIEDITAHPTIKSVATQTQTTRVPVNKTDSAGNVTKDFEMQQSKIIAVSDVMNPKQALILPLDSTIGVFRQQKLDKENDLLKIRPKLEEEIKSKIGFLDELKVMYGLISNSNVALAVWLLWFLFLLFLEMLVLISKVGDKENDYEKTVLHQMQIQNMKLEVLARKVQEN